MKDSEIQKRLSLIADLAEDTQDGIESMIGPFLLYGLAIPAGTALSYYIASIGLARFIWCKPMTLYETTPAGRCAVKDYATHLAALLKQD